MRPSRAGLEPTETKRDSSDKPRTASALARARHAVPSFRLPMPTRSRCVLALAVCRHRGLDDSCRELRRLRQFQHDFMMTTPERRAEFDAFRQTTADFAQTIDKRADRSRILDRLFERFLVPGADAVAAGKLEEAYSVYIGMLSDLEERLLFKA